VENFRSNRRSVAVVSLGRLDGPVHIHGRSESLKVIFTTFGPLLRRLLSLVASDETGDLNGQVSVVIDVLHIVAIVQHTYELLEHGQVFRTNYLAGLREEADFLDF